jgi:hypothetical protein
MRSAIVWLLTVLLAPLGALAEDAVPAVYSGQYFYNFENANFTLDGADECWVVKGDMAKAELPAKTEGSVPWGTAHVVVRGVLGPAGHYGNLGACTHMLKVLELLEVTDKKAN